MCKFCVEGKFLFYEFRWFNVIVDDDICECLWEFKRVENGEVVFWSVREKKNWDVVGVEYIFVSD